MKLIRELFENNHDKIKSHTIKCPFYISKFITSLKIKSKGHILSTVKLPVRASQELRTQDHIARNETGYLACCLLIGVTWPPSPKFQVFIPYLSAIFAFLALKLKSESLEKRSDSTTQVVEFSDKSFKRGPNTRKSKEKSCVTWSGHVIWDQWLCVSRDQNTALWLVSYHYQSQTWL